MQAWCNSFIVADKKLIGPVSDLHACTNGLSYLNDVRFEALFIQNQILVLFNIFLYYIG